MWWCYNPILSLHQCHYRHLPIGSSVCKESGGQSQSNDNKHVACKRKEEVHFSPQGLKHPRCFRFDIEWGFTWNDVKPRLTLCQACWIFVFIVFIWTCICICICLKPKSVLCCIGYISRLKYWVSVAHKDQYLCSLIKLKHSSARFRIEIYTASVNFLRGWRPDGPDFRSKNSVTSDLRCDRLLLWEYVLHRYSLDVIMMMIMMMMIWWRRWWWWRWKWCWYLTGWFEKRLKWKSHNDTLLYLKYLK